MRVRFLTVLSMSLLTTASVSAHYSMLLPDRASVKKDEPVTLLYQFGHPFEHELFDAPKPDSLIVRAPDGKVTDLTGALQPIKVPAGDNKMVTAYRLQFTANQHGDYVFLLRGAPIWMEEDGVFLRDTVKVVLHVQAQKGWDAQASDGFEWELMTRPYGLQLGQVFQARLLPRSLVEVEPYNEVVPKELPPDEHRTRVVKTDPNGVATCSLLQTGWWSLTGTRPGGMMEREGKMRPVHERSTLWVFVDRK
jgi:uncharacterized GH25 family protein